MTADALPELTGARPVWLITLADLALLLVGFFVLLQANQQLDPRALAAGMAEGFGVQAPVMAVASQSLDGFATGSAELPAPPDTLVAWARAEARDPRIRLTVTGATDGTPADIDAFSGSATLLAIDRARAVVAALADAGIPDSRIAIATAVHPRRRHAFVTIAFAGEAGKQP